MTLLTRILAEKRAWVLPLAVGLALNMAASLLVVYPLEGRVRAASARAAAARQNLAAAQASYEQVRATLASKARADADLRKFYTQILPADLAAARRLTYSRLAQLAEEAHLRFERRSLTTETRQHSPLAELRMTMVLGGEYRDIRQFLYRLETAPEFVVIEDVSLAQGTERGAPLVVTLQVATYYQAGSHGS